MDDLLIMTEDDEELACLKRGLTAWFEMKDLGEVKQFLGMEIEHEFNGIKIHQVDYIRTLLHQYRMQDCNPMKTPMDPSIKLNATTKSDIKVDSSRYQQYISELMLAAIATRPDIMFAVSQLSSYNSNPCQRHLAATKHVLGYLKGTINLGIVHIRHNILKSLRGFWSNEVRHLDAGF
jgi:Reverse transcriptase (RNA-dependent DNA polymerase)